MSNTSPSAEANGIFNVDDQEYLTFFLDNEEFGVDILSVKEIRVWSPVTEIPDTPHYLKGVINLRGVIIPIIDLRERFNRKGKEYTDKTVVIVLRTDINHQEVMVGIVVDAVSDVYKVTTHNIRQAPNFGSKVDIRFIKGMATIDEKIVILLNSEKLLDAEELYNINNQVTAVP